MRSCHPWHACVTNINETFQQHLVVASGRAFPLACKTAKQSNQGTDTIIKADGEIINYALLNTQGRSMSHLSKPFSYQLLSGGYTTSSSLIDLLNSSSPLLGHLHLPPSKNVWVCSYSYFVLKEQQCMMHVFHFFVSIAHQSAQRINSFSSVTASPPI